MSEHYDRDGRLHINASGRCLRVQECGKYNSQSGNSADVFAAHLKTIQHIKTRVALELSGGIWTFCGNQLIRATGPERKRRC